MDTPLYTRLIAYHAQNRISFAMPGHKNGRGIEKNLLDCDVTELKTTENLHHPHEYVNESKRLLSKLFNSDESYIMTCGSTAGIQAMLTASLKPGQTLLAACDCHMSVINTCALLGLKIKFIPKAMNMDFLIPSKLCSLEKYIDGADAVLITSPTYYGLCADIAEMAKICHAHKIPLLVDEAHGAHFVSSDRFPNSAIMLGADAVCQSAHKTLNALTGAAFLHIKSNLIDRERLQKSLAMFQTSSPSYVIASSADIARAELENGGWDEICDICDDFKRKITNDTNIKILENDDCTRFVLCFGEYDTTGFEIDEILSDKYGIDIEMADLLNIVLIVTPSNTAADMQALYDALADITQHLEKRKENVKILPPPIFEDVISPQNAFFGDTKIIPLDNSIGEISAAAVTAYPPGIPIIYAGAKITENQLAYIKYLRQLGAEITGADDDMIEVLINRERI